MFVHLLFSFLLLVNCDEGKFKLKKTQILWLYTEPHRTIHQWPHLNQFNFIYLINQHVVTKYIVNAINARWQQREKKSHNPEFFQCMNILKYSYLSISILMVDLIGSIKKYTYTLFFYFVETDGEKFQDQLWWLSIGKFLLSSECVYWIENTLNTIEFWQPYFFTNQIISIACTSILPIVYYMYDCYLLFLNYHCLNWNVSILSIWIFWMNMCMPINYGPINFIILKCWEYR